MAIEHDSITDPDIHEPKGVSTASANEVYVADGAGSGEWIKTKYHINGYIPFDATTPAYHHSVTTSFSPLNPTFSATLVEGFTGETSPNARLKYTGTEDVIAHCSFVFNFENASGADRELEITFYKNGSLMNGGHIIVTSENNHWRSATLTDMVSLSTDDYVEVFVKADNTFTLNIAAASLIIKATPLVV